MARTAKSAAPKITQPKLPTLVEATTHGGDKRVNNPTVELLDFVSPEPPKTLLYPRDTSLDPQLVWRGKDVQDATDLAVPVMPIYRQESIDPKVLIEDLRRSGMPNTAQPSLFAVFEKLPFDQQIEFYQHEQDWTNRFILGDSLTAMASLSEKEGLKGKVQCIYLDPPYGIKFGSNWQVSTRKRDVKDGKDTDFVRQPEQIRAFRDTWKDGIQSYLAYLRDRLVIARDLLNESGSMFVQIGDENVHRVRCLLDEVFGEENFACQISFAKTTGFSGGHLSSICDTIVWYAKNLEEMKYRGLFNKKVAGSEGATKYRPIGDFADASLAFGSLRLATSDQVTSQGATATSDQKARFRDRTWLPPSGLHWKTTVDGMTLLGKAGRIVVEGNSLRYIRFLDDFSVYPLSNVWMDIGGIQSRTDPKIYVVQTAVEAVKRCILMTTDPGDLVLDPTCGSGTTAYVAEQWGRRWITIDTSRVALSLARTRLMSAKHPYYLLADSPEGVRKEAEITGVFAPPYATRGDVRKGFVYERVPHITLKSIANNTEIDTIHARWQEQLEPVRADLNREIGQAWEEWEVPREVGAGWPDKTVKLHGEWWRMRRERQAEIDKSIAKRAETELLYDQPYEDPKRVRVTGPFTVESLSPFRVLPMEAQTATERDGQRDDASGGFVNTVIENLRTAGVQNTVKAQRLTFTSLAPYAGAWLHAAGEYTENDAPKRVAVCVGPEHGTVGTELVKEAAKEAMRGVPFDTLIVCGLAFDPHVTEAAKQFGKLTVLIARMNADLTMGDLLKKTASANLFTVFGEPDLDVQTQPDGKLTVEIRGVDVYDPTTGQIRSNSTDDIACWFLDTDYSGDAFFVRHAYFTGDEKSGPYEKLQRALKADIDPDAWSSLYRTVSRPFLMPTNPNRNIAVKVINHYGDEVMKVYRVQQPHGGSLAIAAGGTD